MDRERFTYEGFSRPFSYVTPQIVDQMGRQALRLDYRADEVVAESAEERTQTLPLPGFFGCFEELRERKLTVNWNNGKTTKEVHTSLLEGLDAYIRLKFPGFCIVTPIKVYAERPHDQADKSVYRFIPVVGLLNEIADGSTARARVNSEAWTGAISNVVMIAPEEGYCFEVGEVPNFPQNDKISNTLVFPAIDFDIDATENPQRDLTETVNVLIENGFSGHVIQSGDPPNGGYQYLADFMMPYNPNMWQSIGQFMRLFTDINNQRLIGIADQLIRASSINQAREIVKEIGPDPNPLTKRSWPVSAVDWGYCYHQVREGMSKLRVLRAKNYAISPKVVAEVL